MSRRWQKDWCVVADAWVNSFQGISTSNSDATWSSLKDCDVLQEVIKKIFDSEKKDVPSYTSNEELSNKFLKEYFPDIYKDCHVCLQNEDDILVLFSLLIYTSCIKCQIQEIMKKNSMFIKPHIQETLTRFFQEIMELGDRRFSRAKVIEAVQRSMGSSASHAGSPFSPVMLPSSLKEFFDSSSPQQQKYKFNNEIHRLKALLEEESAEKNELIEKNLALEESLKKSQKVLNEKSKEIQQLKEDLNHSFLVKANEEEKENENKNLLRDKQDLITAVNELRSENDTLLEMRDKQDNQMKKLLNKITNLECSLRQLHQESDEDRIKLGAFINENELLKCKIKELNQLIEQLKEQSSTVDILNMSSPRDEQNLGESVIELLLLEKENKINDLQKQLRAMQEEFEQALKEKDFKYTTVEQILIENDATIKRLKQEYKQQTVSLNILEQNCLESNEKLKQVKLETKHLKEEVQIKDACISNLEQECSKYKDDYEKLVKELSTAQLESKQLLAEKLELNAQLNNITGRANKLANSVQESEFKIKHLQNLIVEEKSFNADQCKTIENLKEEMALLNSLLDNITQSNTKNEHNIQHLNQEINQKMHVIDSINDQNKNLKAAYEEKCNILKQSEHDKEQLLKECSILNSHVTKSEEKLDYIQNLLNASQNDLKERNSVLNEFKMKLKEMETLSASHELLKSNVEEVNSELINKSECIAKLEQLLTEQSNRSEAELTRAQEELKLKCQNISEYEEFVEQLKKELELIKEDSSEQIQQLKLRNSEFEKLLDLREQSVKSLEKEIDSLQGKLEAQNVQLEKSLNDLTRLDSENEELNSKCSSLVEVNNNVVSECELKLKKMKDDLITPLEIETKRLNEELVLRDAYSSNLEQKCLQLSDENANLSKDLMTLQSELKALSAENVELGSQLSKMTLSANHLESIVKEKDIQMVQLENKIKECESHEQDHKKTIELLKGELSSLHESLEKITPLEIETKRLNEELVLRDAYSSNLEQKCSLLSDENANISKDLLTLQSELKALSAENIELGSQLSKMTLSANHLESKVLEKDIQMVQLENKIMECESHEQDYKKTIELLKGKLSSLHESLEKITPLEIETKRLNEELVLRDAHSLSLEQKCSQLTDENANISKDLLTLQSELKALSAENAGLCSQLSKMTLSANHLQSIVQEKDIQMVQLENKIKECESHEQDHKKTIELLKSKLSLLHESLEKITPLEIETKRLNEELVLRDAHSLSLEQKCSQLTDENANISKDLLTLQSELKALSAENVELGSQLSKMTLSANHLESMVKEKDIQMVQLENKIKECESHEQDHKKTIELLKGELSSLHESLEKITPLEIETKRLNEELVLRDAHSSSLEQKCSQLTDENANISKDLLTLQSELKALSAENVELGSQLSKMTLSANHLESMIQEKDIQMVQLENKIMEFESHEQDHKKTIELLKGELSSLHESLEKVTHSNSENEIKLEHLSQEIVIKQAKIDSLKEEIEKSISENEEISKDLKQNLNEKQLLLCNLSSIELKLSKSEEELFASHALLKELQIDLLKKESVVNELKIKLNVLETVETENQLLKNDFKEIHSELKNKNEQINGFEQLLSKKAEQISQLSLDLGDKINKLKKTEEELKNVQETVEQQGREISEKNELVDHFKNELDQAMQNFSQQIQELEGKNTELEKLLELREEKIKSFEKEIDSLQKQILPQDPQLQEAYDKLFDDFNRLSDENETLNSKYNSLVEANNNVRSEYERKLNKIREQMKAKCYQVLEQKDEKHAKDVKDFKEVIKSNQDHISQLSSQLWDTSDKLIITKSENEELRKLVSELKQSCGDKTNSLVRQKNNENLQNHTPEVRLDVEESFTVTRRQSVRTVPSGMGIKLLPSGKVFPSEDEGEEMFNNECLADLKAGRCQVQMTDPDRVSTLKYRNSLCPPHLKSSYPAETQFIPVDFIQEDDIKGRAGDQQDSKSLFSFSEKYRRKDRTQTSYKKPGPPTPSKNGARSASQTSSKRPGLLTPSKNGARSASQENTNTPNQRRRSFFSKHFGKRDH